MDISMKFAYTSQSKPFNAISILVPDYYQPSILPFINKELIHITMNYIVQISILFTEADLEIF